MVVPNRNTPVTIVPAILELKIKNQFIIHPLFHMEHSCLFVFLLGSKCIDNTVIRCDMNDINFLFSTLLNHLLFNHGEKESA